MGFKRESGNADWTGLTDSEFYEVIDRARLRQRQAESEGPEMAFRAGILAALAVSRRIQASKAIAATEGSEALAEEQKADIHRSCVHDPNRIAKAVKDALAERVAREKTPEQHERDARGRSAEWHQTQANIKAAVEQAAADQAAFREMIAGKGYASPEAFHDKVNPKSEPPPAPDTSPYVTRADLVTSLTRSLASIVKRAMDGGDHTTALDDAFK